MKRKKNVFDCSVGKCDKADRAAAMLKMGAEQKFDEREGEGMKDRVSKSEKEKFFEALKDPKKKADIIQILRPVSVTSKERE